MTTDPSWADLAGSLPTHQEELLSSHQSQPTPQQAVAAGVTPASGSDDTDGWMAGPLGGPP